MSRVIMQHHTKITNLTVTSIPVSQQIAVRHATRNRTATTMRRCSLAALQVLLLACALPPPLQLLLPTPKRWSYAVEALPITSKPIEGTAENLAWQAWLMLPPEQKQLEKSRKVTPKSIFSLPFRDCPPGHQLFQSRCIPTVNINQSDLLAQQVLGLLVGSAAGGAGGTGNDNAYEFDYEDEEYGLGFGEGEPVVMFQSPQQFSGSSSTAGSGNAQQPPARDEPLKFNLFEQKYPTSDYEADLSSSTLEGSGGARPLNEQLPTRMSAEGDRVGASNNESDADATFFNSSHFLDAVQGFFQSQTTASNKSTANTTMSNATTTDPNIRTANASNAERKHLGLSDLHVASSNISTFAVGDIDAIILGAGMPATTTASRSDEAFGGSAGANAAGGNLEPQRISLFKDDNTVQLVTSVIAQSDNNRRKGDQDALRGDVGDLVTAAQQHHNTVAQFLRADALLPLSSAAPYTTTTTSSTYVAADDEAEQGTKIPPLAAKDERPRSVTQQSSVAVAPADTDAQETSFITTTEPEGTTSFQIDETTVVEASEDAAIVPETISLLEAISKQQQLEFQKSKVEPVKEEAPITTTTFEAVVNVETTTADDGSITTETKTIPNETDETTTAKEAYQTNEKSVEVATDTETTTQPLPSAGVLSSTITATTTKTHLTTTPSANRFFSSPAAVATVLAPIRMGTDKQVTGVVISVTAPSNTTDPPIGEEAAASNIDIVSDVPGSAKNDLVNVVASSINSNSNINNDSSNKNKNNKKSPVHFAASAKAKAAMAASELNIEQELRMINELVKGKRQLSALKMAAIKATTTTMQATTATQTSTASGPKMEVKKSANVAENEQIARGVPAVEVRRDVHEATTTPQVATLRAQATTVLNMPLIAASGNENEVPDLATATTTETGRIKAAAQKAATAAATSTKMESDSQQAETTTVENTTAAEALTTIELATTSTPTVSAEPDFEAEAAVANAEATGATLWSRIMPLFGFGEALVEAKPAAGTVSKATTTAVPLASKITGGMTIGSISSSNGSSNDRGSISTDSISDISSIRSNLSNNNKHFDGHIRRNSKIIRIDQLSDNSVAAAAATTNTLEEEATIRSSPTATTATTTTTTSMSNIKSDSIAIAPEKDPAEKSSYWWLPAGWRSHRDTNDGQQPLLFRLWSAFPESQMKAKART